MAEPRDSYPETATHGGSESGETGGGERAVREALAERGEDLASVLESVDEIEDIWATTVLILASADEDEVEHVTQSTANLIAAADGLATDDAATFAEDVGENADELSSALETVVTLQREGHLDDLATVATAFAESHSPAEIEKLTTLLETNGTEIVEAIDVVLDLQRQGTLEDLTNLAETLSALDIDGETVRGIDTILASVGEAHRTSEPVGVLGLLGELRTPDARAGLGYFVGVLKAQGRRLNRR